jgi:protein involved in sex pheromone biosynthesis
MLQKKAEDWDKDVDELQENGEVHDRRAGAAAYLSRLLEMKFGDLDDDARGRLAGADFERLLAWTDRMLDAETLADVFA